MFTGIIEELGVVKSLDKQDASAKLRIISSKVVRDTRLGQSICVNGVCLTVAKREKDLLCFEIMPETLKLTNLTFLKKGDKVNLERALKAEGRFDGHFISGHIDGTGKIGKRKKMGKDFGLEINTPSHLLRYIVLKGAVALDGVSLTVSAVQDSSFCVHLIPYTIENTTMGFKKENEVVNIEVDLLAKYIDRLCAQDKQVSPTKITPNFLKEHGFI